MKVLKDMIREEWRMHADLFGSKSFALFPFAILLVSVFLLFSFTLTGFSQTEIYLGALSLLFFMGLNVGGLGFISDDMASNLLGDMNLLIFSSRTLPVSEKFLVANFLAKDLIYYTVFLVTPVTVAPLLLKSFIAVSIPEVVSLWISGTGLFMLGVGLSFTFASLYNRGEEFVYAIALVFAALFLSGIELLSFTPFRFFGSPSIGSFMAGFSSVAFFLFAGLMLYRPEASKTVRSSADDYSVLHNRIGFSDPVSTKSLIDLNRSGGGIWKVLVSQAVIFGFFSLLMIRLEFLSLLVSAPGMAFALMMSIGSVSVYTWLTRFDSGKMYAVLPLETSEVMESKLRTFMLVSVPISWTFTTVGAYYFGMEGIMAGLLGVPLLNMYLVGGVAYLGGLQPNEMLFDAKNFLGFVLLVTIGMVPMFILSLVHSSSPMAVTASYVSGAVILGLAGYGLFQHGKKKWS